MRKCYLAIDIPVEIKEKINQVQSLFPYNTLQGKIEPHITVKNPVHVQTDLSWLPEVKENLQRIAPFEVTLGSPDFFGKEVLHLTVQSEGVHNVHRTIMESFHYSEEEKKRLHEVDDYIPHITVGLTWEGFSYEELLQMKTVVETFPLPFTFMVKEVVVLGKTEQWSVVERISLEGE